MKVRLLSLAFAFFAALTTLVAPPCRGSGIITFDDLTPNPDGSFITSGYNGLNWTNFVAINGVLFAAAHGLSGYYYGMVSASNVVYNAWAVDAEIGSSGTSFNFLSAYLTGAWNSNLNIEVQGFSGATLLYDTNVVASATFPTLFAFNYLNVNRVRFHSSGGQDAGFREGAGSVNFVMDNLSVEYVPEPSAVLLTALGALTLCPLLKRRRT